MKHHKIRRVIFLICGILYWGILPGLLTVSASESQEDLIEQYEEVLEISVSEEKEVAFTIKLFDVNEEGWYAIGYRNNTIQIYDSMDVFRYGYHFHTADDYWFTLKENSIIIYLGKSDVSIEVDSSGKCIGVEEGTEEESRYRTRKQVGNMTYYLERDIGVFPSGYSRLVKMDENGAKTILYDVTILGYFVGASHYLLISLFPIAAVKTIRDKIKEEEQADE